ncbi:hypothetical protein [Tabrizicola sp.]|uniref:hypothetical protein n=1 Tax=Tabrizicola sp. TaxID=2005166 RepID=UPI003F3FEA8B
MPLFLRSLPLSFGTLWHYIFLLPLVLLFMLPLMVLTLLPLVGSLISVTIFTFISFVGFRCALTAHGKGNEPAVEKLVRSSMFFGVIATVVSAVLFLLCVGAVLGLMHFGVEGNVDAPWGDALPMVPSLAVIAFFVMNGLYTCAVAVPMTAAAVEATSMGRDADPIFGIGRGMFSLALIWMLWLYALFNCGLIEFVIEQVGFILYTALGNLIDLAPVEQPEFNPVAIVGAILALLWGSCWYYATAIIAWQDEVKRREANRVTVREVSRTSAEELRALREARMPGGRDLI